MAVPPVLPRRVVVTDYAVPTTAESALERAAQEVRVEAKAHRQEAHYRIKMAEECERIASFLDGEAARYERYQPSSSSAESAVGSEE